jgi:hypothetical protein
MPVKSCFSLLILSLSFVSACAHKVATAPIPAPPPPATTSAAPTDANLEAFTLPQGIQRVGPASLYPAAGRTPGFPNPTITQSNISQNICNPNWSTSSIRPPSSYTTNLKKQQMQQWGLSGSPAGYEEDHFISLELGGNPTDPRNLWPEPYLPKPGAREKDQVENYLHKQVCSGAMTLLQAQRAIVTDWYSVYQRMHP